MAEVVVSLGYLDELADVYRLLGDALEQAWEAAPPAGCDCLPGRPVDELAQVCGVHRARVELVALARRVAGRRAHVDAHRARALGLRSWPDDGLLALAPRPGSGASL